MLDKKEAQDHKRKLFRILIIVFAIVILLFLLKNCSRRTHDRIGYQNPIEQVDEVEVYSTEGEFYEVGVTENMDSLRFREDSNIWSLAKQKNTIEYYQRYLKSFPEGEFVAQAEKAISHLEQMKVKIEAEKARNDELITAEQTIATELRNKILKEIDDNMVQVQGGTFIMGCPDYYRPPTWEDNKPQIHGADRYGPCAQVENPAHEVTLSSFSISKYEVTQAQWEAVMGNNPSKFAGCSNCPVEFVSWEEVQSFISVLNQLSGSKYRLPTEAEWEYAARGANKNSDHKYEYAGSNDLDSVAWWIENSSLKTHPVGQKKPNELGIYDMTGNVSEYCQDWYDKYYYKKSTGIDPKGPSSGIFHVRRGGNFYSGKVWIRVTEREILKEKYSEKSARYGFRLAL